MTVRTTSAMRRRVVSRSSEVARTSDISSNKGSTANCFPELFRTDPMVRSMIAAAIEVPGAPRCEYSPGSLLPRDNTNVGQIAIAFGIVKSVADDKFVGNGEAHIVALQRQFPARRLIQQRSDFQRLGLMRQ